MREPKLIIATGGKGVGKTYTTCKVIGRYIRANAQTGKEGRKVLIFDVNEEYDNTELKKNGHEFQTKLLAVEDIAKFAQQKNPEVRRILARDKNGQPLGIDGKIEILNKILKYFRSGLLVMEDINNYLIDTKTADVISIMTTNRHRDLDIYIHLQSLSPVTTRMWQNCAFVRFHKQNDSVTRYKNRLPIPEMYFIAETLVNIQCKSDRRFFCYVDNEMSKISGKFSKRAFMVAAYNYLLSHPKEITKYKQRFTTRKDAYTKGIALGIKELTESYYGNED